MSVIDQFSVRVRTGPRQGSGGDRPRWLLWLHWAPLDGRVLSLCRLPLSPAFGSVEAWLSRLCVGAGVGVGMPARRRPAVRSAGPLPFPRGLVALLVGMSCLHTEASGGQGGRRCGQPWAQDARPPTRLLSFPRLPQGRAGRAALQPPARASGSGDPMTDGPAAPQPGQPSGRGVDGAGQRCSAPRGQVHRPLGRGFTRGLSDGRPAPLPGGPGVPAGAERDECSRGCWHLPWPPRDPVSRVALGCPRLRLLLLLLGVACAFELGGPWAPGPCPVPVGGGHPPQQGCSLRLARAAQACPPTSLLRARPFSLWAQSPQALWLPDACLSLLAPWPCSHELVAGRGGRVGGRFLRKWFCPPLC